MPYDKLYSFHGGPHYLSTISLKDSHSFKIAESVISFCLNFFFDLEILNIWGYFSEMVDHVTCHDDLN